MSPHHHQTWHLLHALKKDAQGEPADRSRGDAQKQE